MLGLVEYSASYQRLHCMIYAGGREGPGSCVLEVFLTHVPDVGQRLGSAAVVALPVSQVSPDFRRAFYGHFLWRVP